MCMAVALLGKQMSTSHLVAVALELAATASVVVGLGNAVNEVLPPSSGAPARASTAN